MDWTGPNTFNENETIAKYEIMDGAPVRGESIPIRVFLAGYELMPTMKDVNKKFSVRYYLNLVLVDEEDRRYFKQQVSLSSYSLSSLFSYSTHYVHFSISPISFYYFIIHFFWSTETDFLTQ